MRLASLRALSWLPAMVPFKSAWAALLLLSAVLAELRGSDRLYRQRGRRGFLAPPPGRALLG